MSGGSFVFGSVDPWVVTVDGDSAPFAATTMGSGRFSRPWVLTPNQANNFDESVADFDESMADFFGWVGRGTSR